MNTNIYYFTGTGNSLSVARKIGEKLGSATLHSIARAIKQENIETGEVTGIVCPIYMYDIPYLVVDFIKKLKNPGYLFIVFDGGGESGSCLKKAEKLFASQNLQLSSAFLMLMPDNYTPYGCPPEEKQEKVFAKAEKMIEEIVTVVSAKKRHFDRDNTGFFKTYIHPGLLYKLGYANIKRMDKSFLVEDTCNGCTICQQVCPVNNIKMEDKKPVWTNNCQQCYACLQWCPQVAIQYGKKTAGIPRYQNPEIGVKDIINSAPR